MPRRLSFLNIDSSGDLEEISLKDVCAVEIENTSAETCYVETSRSKSYICPITSGNSRKWTTEGEESFEGDIWIHFAAADLSKASGNALVITQKKSS